MSLSDQLKQWIEAHGPMPFDQFMDRALYTPALGYYSSPRPKLGKAGDFVTAPELSSHFAHCLAKQCLDIIRQLPESWVILEFGGGSGALAADCLNDLEAADALPERYYILELSAQLQAQQQETLSSSCSPACVACVEWLSALPSSPITGIIIANEVLDAMPVHRFRWHQGLCQEAYVDWQGDFVWRWQSPSAQLHAAVQALSGAWCEGYQSEINLRITPWIQALSQCLAQGAILLADYGYPRSVYYHPDRHMGTLMCYQSHRVHADPLVAIGEQDITAHVDFTAVALAAEVAGLSLYGYTNQAAFLMACGVLSSLPDPEQTQSYFSASQAVKMLTLPHEMGESIKVMALGRGISPSLRGFAWLDLQAGLSAGG